jgi:CPA2 family monovalent cation:H+ antiporter-2
MINLYFYFFVLAIRRYKKYITHIEANTKIETDDMMYLFGSTENISRINQFIVLKTEDE